MAPTSDDSARVAEIRAMILAQARAQAEALVATAEKEAAAELAEKKSAVDAWAKERDRVSQEAADKERKKRVAAAATAARGRVLAARARVLDEAIVRINARLGETRKQGDYAELLKNMLVEAVLSVRSVTQSEELDVHIDERDVGMVTSDFLGSVEIVLTFTHSLGVHLCLSPERIVTAGGVVVTVKNSNVRCNNTLEERLMAKKPELLRQVAQEVLRAGFSDGTE